MNIIYFIIIDIFIINTINKFVKYTSCVVSESGDHDDTKTDNVDLDLGKIDPNNFEIFKFQDGPEGYMITPKDGKKLDMVNMWIDVIWLKHENLECESVILYNTYFNEFLIVLTITDGTTRYSLHYVKNQRLSNLGVVEFLDLNNYNSKDLDLNRRQTIDIGDNFDKLYFDYTFKEYGVDTYERFDVYDDEIFIKINEGKNYTIWDNDIGATKIEVYKRNKENWLMKIFIDAENSLFMTYRDTKIRWDYITERDFDIIVGNEALKKFENLEMNPRFYIDDGRVTKRIDIDDEDFIDISKHSIFCDYESRNIMDDHYIVISPTNQEKIINKIVQGDTIINEGELKNVSLTFVKTNNRVYYIEITATQNNIRIPNIYYIKQSELTPWVKLDQHSFYISFQKNIKESENPTYLKYLEIYGSPNGTIIPKLPGYIDDKIQSLLVLEDISLDDNEDDGDMTSDTDLEKYPELDYIHSIDHLQSDQAPNINDGEGKGDPEGQNHKQPEKDGNALRSTDKKDEEKENKEDKCKSSFVANKITLTISIIILLISLNNLI